MATRRYHRRLRSRPDMPLLPRFRRYQEAADDRAKLTKRLLESGEAIPETEGKVLSLIGDEVQLRGIPCVGPNSMGGAIPGTRPGNGIFKD